VTEDWRKWHNEEHHELGPHHILPYLGDQTMGDEISGACGTYGTGQKCIQHFGGEPERLRHS
jgi:hypothetical protein